MIDKKRRGVARISPEPLRSGLLADIEVEEAILSRLSKHPERNPLTTKAVHTLAERAIEAWGDDALMGTDFKSYMESFYPLYPEVAERLVACGYALDVEVAVEADTSQEASDLPV